MGYQSKKQCGDPEGKTRILLIDDEEVMLETMCEILVHEGMFEVDMAMNATEAINKLRENKYKLIITDLRMPGISGYELYEWIMENQPDMVQKVLFTSGDPYEPEAKNFLDQTKKPCLKKPFGINELMDFIHASL